MKLIAFIESVDYVIGPWDSLCENGMIDNLSECQKAAKQLNIPFNSEEDVNGYPGGCYLSYKNINALVYFNKNLKGTPNAGGDSRPICGKGKDDKHFIKTFELWYKKENDFALHIH